LSVAWHEALRPCFKQVILFFEAMSFCEAYAGKKDLNMLKNLIMIQI